MPPGLSERQPQPEAPPAQVKPQAEVQIYPHSALAFMPVVCQAPASSPCHWDLRQVSPP